MPQNSIYCQQIHGKCPGYGALEGQVRVGLKPLMCSEAPKTFTSNKNENNLDSFSKKADLGFTFRQVTMYCVVYVLFRNSHVHDKQIAADTDRETGPHKSFPNLHAHEAIQLHQTLSSFMYHVFQQETFSFLHFFFFFTTQPLYCDRICHSIAFRTQ